MEVFQVLGVILMGLIGLFFILFSIVFWWGSSVFSTQQGSGEKLFALIVLMIGLAFECFVFSHIHIQIG